MHYDRPRSTATWGTMAKDWEAGIDFGKLQKDRLERVSSKTCNSFNAVDGLIPVGFYGKKARKQCRNSGCRIVKKKNNRTRCQKFQQGGRKTKRRRKYKKKRRSRKRKSRKSSRKSRRKSKR